MGPIDHFFLHFWYFYFLSCIGDGRSKYAMKEDKKKIGGLWERRKCKWWKKGGKAKMR
jgi:hypothetical protein